MKKYVIIAGVNGAGKSIFYSLVPKFTEYKKINLDDVVREIGDWKNTADVIKAGGHGINEIDIERRYKESLNNFKIVIDKCDLVAMYDNTESFRRFAFYRKGKLARLSSKVPEWFSLIS